MASAEFLVHGAALRRYIRSLLQIKVRRKFLPTCQLFVQANPDVLSGLTNFGQAGLYAVAAIT